MRAYFVEAVAGSLSVVHVHGGAPTGSGPVLAAGYAVVVTIAAVASTTRLLAPVGTAAFLAMAVALGSGSGATFALVAKVTDPLRVGGVTGLVGAAGGIGGSVPPLIQG